MAEGPGLSDLPGWRISLLLLVFVAITFILEHALEFVEKRLKDRKVRSSAETYTLCIYSAS